MKYMRIWVAGGALAALATAYGLLGGSGAAPSAPAAHGIVAIAPRGATAPQVPHGSVAPVAIGALPAQVEAQIRQAYPLLTDVAFRCEARGCAVTATIPPPTDEAFLARRQEMLLGGLARTVEAMGYMAAGPVQMDEVSENLFHIRLAVTAGGERRIGGDGHD